MKRRNFIKNIGPALTIAQITMISSCQNEQETIILSSSSEEEKEFSRISTLFNTDGYYLEGKIVYVNLSHINFVKLEVISGFCNIIEAGILLWRSDSNLIKAFNNCCPHQGARASWILSNGRFKCENHGNSYNSNEINIVECNSNSISGGLSRYPVTLYKTFLKVVKF
ncbi:MAG: Rieske 2Fe-2S domain-containing protein [Cytophagales bacterium]|nr:Rieske 2Fe-2S domain-containing protein [Cytophagales bacterium]